MELDSLKLAWKGIESKQIPVKQIKSMTKENNHPVLKGIRRQLILEIIFWTIFLVVFYDFFDGHKKPLSLNLLLVASILLILVHSCLGYLSFKNLVCDQSIKNSLQKYLMRIRWYALISVSSRVLAVVSLLLFFTSVIAFDTEKYFSLFIILTIIVFQVTMLYRIWARRIRQLEKSIAAFDLEV